MSGGSTLTLLATVSAQKIWTLSVSSMSDNMVAAMNSAGWWALSHAVW